MGAVALLCVCLTGIWLANTGKAKSIWAIVMTDTTGGSQLSSTGTPNVTPAQVAAAAVPAPTPGSVQTVYQSPLGAGAISSQGIVIAP